MNKPIQGNFNVVRYECDFQQIGTNKYVDTECNSITFINYGTTVAQIESVVLQPNQQLMIEGNAGEFTMQRFLVNFGTFTTGNNVVVIRKRYVNI
jgi:hypothetical protein